MIQCDVCDQAGVGLDCVYRIQPPAHSNFEYRDVDICIGEHKQRCDRAVLEIRQRFVLARRFNALERSDDLLVGRLLAINPDTFVVANNVW